MDIIRPLKLESPASGGTELDMFPTETDPTEDYAVAKGVAIEDTDTIIDKNQTDGGMEFRDEKSGLQPLRKLTLRYRLPFMIALG